MFYMRKLIFLLIGIFFLGRAQSQFFVMPNVTVTITSGAVLDFDGLTLTPSADYYITDNTLDKFTTVLNPLIPTYISRVYRSANPMNPFTGSARINYLDGAELNGIPENKLTLYTYDNAVWNVWLGPTRDGILNFVFTNPVTSPFFKEFTLAGAAQLLLPMPGFYYQDADGDGFGNPNVVLNFTDCNCALPGYVTNNWDCDDTNPAIKPGFLGCPLVH